MFTEKPASDSMDERSCCSICNCLGYCAEQNNQSSNRPSLKLISPRTFREFEKSANSGCRYCDYTLQSFQLLGSDLENPEVELLCYADSPTELHSAHSGDACDIVEIYPCAGSESSFPQVANDVPRENVPENALQFIKENYTRCQSSHGECAQLVSKLPKRVLKISESQFHLVEPDEGTKAPYATLSYSWGGKGEFQITTKSYKWLTDGFEKAKLPIIFREAAMVARSLGIEYIWIDRLCIIQDDDKDWEEQAAQMGQIYESAAITIAASLSGNPYEPLFTSRNAKYGEFELYDDLERIEDDVVFKARRKMMFGRHAKTGRPKDVDPLDTRAWGLQEKLLSHRLISFTGGEMQWTCRSTKTCECRARSHQAQPLFKLPVKESRTESRHVYAKAWSKIVESYAERNLTVETDRLPALSGVAKKFLGLTKFTYVAGLWRETLCYDLMWQCDTVRPDPKVAGSPPLPAYMGPSFSWVSTPSTVNYRLARHTYPGTRTNHIDMLSCDYKAKGPDDFGTALGASMRIRGTIIEARLRQNTTSPMEHELLIMDKIYQTNADQRKICEFSVDVHHKGRRKDSAMEHSRPDSDNTNGQTEGTDRDIPVLLLGLYSIHHRNYLYQNFLILKPLLQGETKYQRVGVGSGKIYDKNDIPELSHRLEPFDWLAVDFRGENRSIVPVVDPDIYLI